MRTFFILFFTVLLLLSASFSHPPDQSGRGWEFETGPTVPHPKLAENKRVGSRKSETELKEALAEFAHEQGYRVRYRFSGDQLFPVLIAGFRSRVYAGAPEEQAREFLEEHRRILGVSTRQDDLLYLGATESPLGNHVRFQPAYQGIPIYGAHVGVHLNWRGEVEMANHLGPSDLEWGGSAIISYDRSITLALSFRQVRSLRLSPHSELVVVPERGRARPAWKVQLAANDPLGDWQLLIDAQSSEVIETRNLLRYADGTGKAFDPNPVVSTRNNALRDNKDAASAVPATAYLLRTLRDLDGSGTLTGPYATTSRTPNRALQPSLNFDYTRDNKRFEEVNAYFHVDSMQRYIQSLGFKKLVNRSVPMNVHALKYEDGRTLGDDSYYSTLDGGIYFGDGGVDDAEDGEIIAHEYAHAILSEQVPGMGETRETGAVLEGFADYWAAAYFSSVSGSFQDTCIGDWDATEYSIEDPPCLRRVDRDKHYPEDLKNDPHQDGEIWSACLWNIRGRLGREKANQLILEANYLLTPAADFREAAYAALQADQSLFNAANSSALRKIFTDRGIFTSSDENTIPLFPGITQAGTIGGGAEVGGLFSPVQYTAPVTSNVSRIRIDLKGLDSGDLDLFVRRNQPVTIGSDGVPVADFRSQSSGGQESVVIDELSNPPILSGTYYITLANFSSTSVRYQLTVTLTPNAGQDIVFLKSGETKKRFIDPAPPGEKALDKVQFAFDNPSDTTLLQVDIASTEPAELDLFGRLGAKVQMTSSGSIIADVYSERAGGDEHLYLTRASIPALRKGEYFFAVSTKQSARAEYSITITAASEPLVNKLYFPFFLVGQEPLLGPGTFATAMAILNDTGQAAVATIEPFANDGTMLADAVQRVLQPGEQFAIFINQLFNFRENDNIRGWVEISSNQPLKGFFLQFDNNLEKVMDGADVSGNASKELIFPHVERKGSTFNTLVALCNPGAATANILYQEYNPAGQKVFSESLTIPPRGSLIGGTKGFDRTSGFVRVTSNVPLVGAEFFGDGNKMAALKAVPPGVRNIMFFPHYAVNQGYSSTLYLSNPTGVGGDFLIFGYLRDGDLRPLISRSIGAFAQIVEPIGDLLKIDPLAPTEIGHIKVQSNALDAMVGFVKIDYSDAGGSSSTAIPSFSTPQRILTFAHVANETPSGKGGTGSLFTTGITLLADDTDASYDVAVFDRNGKIVAVSDPFVLKRGQKVSKVLAAQDLDVGFLSPKLVASSGYVKVRSNIPIYGFELFFTRSLYLNSAVPPQ